MRCRCKHSVPHPIRLLLRENPGCATRTLADELVHLRCIRCGGCRVTVHLCEDAHGVGSLPKSITPGWALLLHDGAGEDAAPDRTA